MKLIRLFSYLCSVKMYEDLSDKAFNKMRPYLYGGCLCDRDLIEHASFIFWKKIFELSTNKALDAYEKMVRTKL